MEDFTDQAKHPIRMTYRAVGSSTGIAEFVNGNSTTPAADFGSGDLPLPIDVWTGLQANGIKVMQLPILLGAVSIFHNVDGVDLDLDACLLARIFNRDITVWGHEDIVKRNPSLEGSTLPISVARRVRGSSSTDSVTNVSILGYCHDNLLGHSTLIRSSSLPIFTVLFKGLSRGLARRSGRTVDHLAGRYHAL